MHVLVLYPRPGLQGPIPKMVPSLNAEMEALGHQVTCAYWSRRSDKEGIAAKVFGRAADLINVVRAVRRDHPDVVLVHTAHNNIPLLRDVPLCLFARPSNGKLVLWFHGSASNRLVAPGRRLFKAFSRFVATRSDLLLVLSTEELEQWKTFEPRAHIALVSNPLGEPVPDVASLIQARLDARGPARLMFVARLIEEKGVLKLLDAAETLVQEGRDDFEVVLAGSGPLEDAIRKRVADSVDLRSRVRLTGYIGSADLRREYARADVFVLPSWWREGLPHALVEAMSFGVPAVVTGIRGMRDHVQDGVTGLLVEPRDADGLAAALGSLIDSRELRARMGTASFEHSRVFDPRVVTEGYLKAIGDLTEPQPDGE